MIESNHIYDCLNDEFVYLAAAAAAVTTTTKLIIAFIGHYDDYKLHKGFSLENANKFHG